MLTKFLTIVLLSVICTVMGGNEYDQYQTYRQFFNNIPYLAKNNKMKQQCTQTACTELERGTSSNPQCVSTNCVKRALQDDVGPFWANRGKKDPTYRTEPLYAEEPHWILVRRAPEHISPITYDIQPFFITRGKKSKYNMDQEKETIQNIFPKMHLQNRRDSDIRSEPEIEK